jgi:hypothetical protein
MRRSVVRASVLVGAAGLSLLLAGCGDDDGGTRFGSLEDVQDYRSSIDPVIDAVSAIEAQVQERAVGSSNAATAANLNAVYLGGQASATGSAAVLRPHPAAAASGDTARRHPQVDRAAPGRLRSGNRLCEIDVALGDRDDCRLLA